MPSPILARADALMQRRLHGQAATNDVPTLTNAIDAEGFPLLLEVETPATSNTAMAPENTANVAAETRELANTPDDTPWREQLAAELAQRVEERVLAELPRLIESVVRDILATKGTSKNTRQTP